MPPAGIRADPGLAQVGQPGGVDAGHVRAPDQHHEDAAAGAAADDGAGSPPVDDELGHRPGGIRYARGYWLAGAARGSLDERQPAAGGRRPPGRRRYARVGQVHSRWRSTMASKVWPGRAGSVGVGGVDVEPAGGGLGGEDLQHRRGQVRGGDLVSLPGQQRGARTRCLPRRPAPWREGPAAGGAAGRSTPPAPGDAAGSAAARCRNWPRRRPRTGGSPPRCW